MKIFEKFETRYLIAHYALLIRYHYVFKIIGDHPITCAIGYIPDFRKII